MADTAYGLVTLIYPPNKSWLNFKISDSSVVPKDGYFQVFQSHANYKETYSLLLAAAINRFNVKVKTVTDVKTTEYANVEWVMVTWD